MIWEHIPKKHPKIGTKRERKHFAFLPITISVESKWYTVWLESYVEVQEYRRNIFYQYIDWHFDHYKFIEKGK